MAKELRHLIKCDNLQNANKSAIFESKLDTSKSSYIVYAAFWLYYMTLV